jgi:DNA-binding response OmpR family regulator
VKKKILIAAGNDLHSRMLARAVSKAAGLYNTVTTNTGATVISSAGIVDLFFVQDELVDMTGLEACTRLLAKFSEEQPPVILFSYRSDIADSALKQGVTGFLKLPCRPSTISELADKWMAWSSKRGKSHVILEQETVSPSSPSEAAKLTTAEKNNPSGGVEKSGELLRPNTLPDQLTADLALEPAVEGLREVAQTESSIQPVLNVATKYEDNSGPASFEVAPDQNQPPDEQSNREPVSIQPKKKEESLSQKKSSSPLKTVEEKALATEDEAKLGEKTTVLLIDDSKLIHATIGKVLEENGVETIHAMDGLEGLQQLSERIPDLIICDIDMPNMNGFEFCAKAKESAVTQEVPIIILSARGSGIDIDKGFDVGANDFLTKPVHAEELISRIDQMVVKNAADQDKRETILVVDDSLLIRNMMKQGLSQQGFEIILGEDGKEGLQLAINHHPDLVITDFEMPQMNGRELTRELREREDLADTPVIMLTAADSVVDRAKGEHAGVSAFLSKPFQPEKLVVIVEKLVAERRLIRERQVLKHYVSESALSVAAAAADGKESIEMMRAKNSFVSILFSDIVGFTPLTEAIEPEKLLGLLNEYFDYMTKALKGHNATIDKFIGDAIMALFPENKQRDKTRAAYDAVAGGFSMLSALKSSHLSDDIRIRVGINSGYVIMGDIGSRLYRRDYTVIGDNVNIAARLESSADANSVLISDDTYNLVKDLVAVEDSKEIQVKGKSGSILTHKVVDIIGP